MGIRVGRLNQCAKGRTSKMIADFYSILYVHLKMTQISTVSLLLRIAARIKTIILNIKYVKGTQTYTACTEWVEGYNVFFSFNICCLFENLKSIYPHMTIWVRNRHKPVTVTLHLWHIKKVYYTAKVLQLCNRKERESRTVTMLVISERQIHSTRVDKPYETACIFSYAILGEAKPTFMAPILRIFANQIDDTFLPFWQCFSFVSLCSSCVSFR